MAASMTFIPVPSMEAIQKDPLHFKCVKLLAEALASMDYGVKWETNNDGLLTPPRGIITAVSQVYGKLRQHPLIGEHIIPESVLDNPAWLGYRSDRILCHETATIVTNKKIHWDVAIMAASVFLRQKYLEVLADIHLWNMGAGTTTTESGPRPVEPSYRPGEKTRQPRLHANKGIPTSPYLSERDTPYGSEDVFAAGDDETPARTYFVQNRYDYRLLNPCAIRALLHGNYRINEKAEPERIEGMNIGMSAFAGLSQLDDMTVSLFGMQYRSVSVRACNEPVPSGSDRKQEEPPSYDELEGIDVCPQICFLAFHKQLARGLAFGETGGVTFVRQPHLSGQSSSVVEPIVPSNSFFDGTGVVSHNDAMRMWASTSLATVSVFGLIKRRILKQAFATAITRSRSADDLFEDQRKTAQRTNHQGIDPRSVDDNSSATIVRFGYNDSLTEASVRHFALHEMMGDYVKKQGNGTELYLFNRHHILAEHERRNKLEARRNKKSCDRIWHDTCCRVWCGDKDYCKNTDCFGCPDECPTCGICGIICTWFQCKWPAKCLARCLCNCCCCK